MYRSRLGVRLDADAEQYLSSTADDAEIARYDIAGTMAHVLMLRDAGIIGARDARRVLAALRSIRPASLRPARGTEDIHELVESVVTKKAGRAAGGRMHAGRSRNDQVATDIRLKMRDDINSIAAGALELAGAMISLARRHARTAMPLYTHMRRAQYGTLSHYLIAYADALLRDVRRLDALYERTDLCPLGSGPVGGTSLRVRRGDTARLLGFAGIVENSIDATSSRDHMLEFLSCIAIMMAGLSRAAEDLVVWSSPEFGFVDIGDEVASPSSAMPQKKNPDVLEITRARAAESIGALAGAMAATKGLASGYGRDLQQIKPAAWAASRTARGALGVMRLVYAGLRVNRKRMAEASSGADLDALEAAEHMVARGGVPFRAAHAAVAGIARRAAESGVPLSGVPRRHVEAAARRAGADAGALAAALEAGGADAALRRRVSRGSAGYRQQDAMLRSRAKRIASMRRALGARVRAVADADKRLRQRVDAAIRAGAR